MIEVIVQVLCILAFILYLFVATLAIAVLFCCDRLCELTAKIIDLLKVKKHENT